MVEQRMDTGRLREYLGDYLRQKGLPLRKNFRCLSPYHEDRHPSMGYNREANNVHCFACGATYDVFDLVGMDYGLDNFMDRYHMVCELFGVARQEHTCRAPEKRDGAVALPAYTDRGREWLALKDGAVASLDYFEARGITAESCVAYDLFQTADRAYFPVVEQGLVTGWSSRSLSEEVQPRYKNSTGSLGIWNGDYLAQPGGGQALYIAEGIVDAICLEQAGHRAVALCGSRNTGKLLQRLKAAPEQAATWRYVACGDGDEAGRRMNEVLAREMAGMGLRCDVLAVPVGQDVGALYRRDPAALEALPETGGAVEVPAGPGGQGGSAAALLDDFFAERARRAAAGGITTGLPALDKLLDGGLHTGLYVLGAISSLGKTSLALQMADAIAGQGRDVLFVSLEQSRFELMAKSLCRIGAGVDYRHAFTVRQLLGGQPLGGFAGARLLEESRALYQAIADNLFLWEGVCDIGAGDIRGMVEQHRAARGQAPVVVVDYLQILAATDSRASDKQNTDRAVVELKRISRDFDVPVLAVSSFNRENYRTAVSMEAFKESGAVEYSADVLLGLQLAGAGEKGFDVNAAKLKNPRELELVLLKNRNGIPYGRIPLSYDAKFHLFRERVKGAGVRFA